MNVQTRRTLAITFLALALSSALAQAQSTAFTYQGQLSQGTNAANGSYDLRFAVYDANVAGNFIAGPLTNSAVAVSNGLFTVSLNFGTNVFTGTNYWVEMGVRTNGGGGFSTLVPRQPLTPTPYALYAPQAAYAAQAGYAQQATNALYAAQSANASNATALSASSPQINSLCPVGSIMAYMGATAPPGWLLCDGSAVSRTTYAALFAVMGTTVGAPDGSTFNLPDTRGLFLRGWSAGVGTVRDPDALLRTAFTTGGNTGNAIGSYEDEAFKSHAHTSTRPIGFSQGAGSYHASEWTLNTGRTDPITTDLTGGSETRPKNFYVNYIIKY